MEHEPANNAAKTAIEVHGNSPISDNVDVDVALNYNDQWKRLYIKSLTGLIFSN